MLTFVWESQPSCARMIRRVDALTLMGLEKYSYSSSGAHSSSANASYAKLTTKQVRARMELLRQLQLLSPFSLWLTLPVRFQEGASTLPSDLLRPSIKLSMFLLRARKVLSTLATSGFIWSLLLLEDLPQRCSTSTFICLTSTIQMQRGQVNTRAKLECKPFYT